MTMPHTNTAVHVGGLWLAAASFLIIATLALHGPIAPDLADQMTRIAERPVAWVVSHWIAAASLSLYTVAGLIVLTSGSRLTDAPWTLTAWAVVPVGALWTLVTAVAEATAVTDAAIAGSTAMFEAWWSFAEGRAHGFAFVALAVAVIAGHDARSPEAATPAWSAWIGAMAAVASFAGWAAGMWFEIRPANLLWVAASILMSAWTLWFGLALARQASSPSRDVADPPLAPAGVDERSF